MRFFAPCPPGAEDILYQELIQLGATGLARGIRGVGFEGDLQTAYQASLRLRTASRILLELARADAVDENDIYRIAMQIPWEKKFSPTVGFACRATGMVKNPRFATLRLKDAIADRFMKTLSTRPTVDKVSPDIRIEAHWKGRGAAIFLNWSGPPLHERGYRLEHTETAIRETTAAAILALAGWQKDATYTEAFVDPVCGSGTLLAEAAMMAVGAPPGVHRKKWGFSAWADHDENLWRDILNQARIDYGESLANMPVMMGYDIDPEAIKSSRNNLRRAGLGSVVRVAMHDIRQGRPDNWPTTGSGLLCADPPYGHRQSELPVPVYSAIGTVFRTLDPGWRLALLAPDRNAAASSYLKADKFIPVVSGGLNLVMGLYSRQAKKESNIVDVEAERPQVSSNASEITEKKEVILDTKAPALRKALQRNLSALEKWAKKCGISSYRIWDSNMPEFNAAVDWYEGKWLHVQEFEAPAKVSPDVSQRRLSTLVFVLKELLACTNENVFLKTRKRGIRPYTGRNGHGERMIMKENEAKFFVNFTHYLDTGIFLDHRPTRALIRQWVGNGSFLNLFSYTGSATVMAALGGASSTVSVDASNTYLNWCRDNFRLNRVSGMQHKLIRSDAIEWLRNSKDKFSLIFADPPTYSNGAGRGDWSVQEHHQLLIDLAMEHLKPSGMLIFSVNYRRFVLEPSLRKKYVVKDLTQETLHPDFAILSHTHRCWSFSRL